MFFKKTSMVCLGLTIAMGAASAGNFLYDNISSCAAVDKLAQFRMHGYMIDQQGKYVKRTVTIGEKNKEQSRVNYDVGIDTVEYNSFWDYTGNATYCMSGIRYQNDDILKTRFAEFSSGQSLEEITGMNDIIDGNSHQYSFDGCVAKEHRCFVTP
ncbi:MULTISPECIES: hypothetical protein [Cysteiniphilum]|uniref:hypothetical protein n=1 Tax=Cysteiniphilum TaxID=2056696 RepID=UPI0017820F16|nr:MULTISPECIES: hypothetical protein [Cysteiniphilum]